MTVILSRHCNSVPRSLRENAETVPSNMSRLPPSKFLPTVLTRHDLIQRPIDFSAKNVLLNNLSLNRLKSEL